MKLVELMREERLDDVMKKRDYLNNWHMRELWEVEGNEVEEEKELIKLNPSIV